MMAEQEQESMSNENPDNSIADEAKADIGQQVLVAGLQLPQDTSTEKPPWWDSKLMVAIAAALIAAAVPLTTAVIQTHQSKQALQLKKEELDQNFKLEYMKLLTQNYKDSPVKEAILDFVSQTANSEEMRAWALGEGSRIRATIEEQKITINNLKNDISAIRGRQSALTREVRELELEKSQVATENAEAQQEIKSLKIELAETKETLEEKISQLSAAEQKLDELTAEPKPIRPASDRSNGPVVTDAFVDYGLPQAIGMQFEFRPLPPALLRGKTVTIDGERLGDEVGVVVMTNENGLSFSPATVLSWSSNRVVVELPDNLPSSWSGLFHLQRKDFKFSNQFWASYRERDFK